MLRGRIQDRVVYSPHPVRNIPECSVYTYVKSFLRVEDPKIAAVDYTTSYTRKELLRAFERYAAGFQSLGVKAGDHVCVHLCNSVESFVAVFGLIFAGATTILAKPSLSHAELIYEITDGEATYVLTEPSNADKVRKVCDEMNIQTTARFVLGEASGFVSTLGFAQLDEKNFREVPVTDPRNTLVALLYTSGTTGRPKGVEISHHSFVASMVVSRSVVCPDESDVFLAWNPITHMSGFLFTLPSACSGSTCVILPPTISFEEFIEVCTKYQVTYLFSFTTRLNSLVNEMLRTNCQLHTMRKLTVGGSVVTEGITRHARHVFPNLQSFRIFFGTTECVGMVTTPGQNEICITDLGVPTPNLQIKIVSVTTGKPLGPNEDGEILYRTPSQMRGYYKNPKATAEYLDSDGWCHSGDIGYYDENGRLNYVERKRDLIKCMDNQIVSVTTGKPLGPNEDGEILYRTPSQMRGYYKNPKATAEYLDSDGWCHSGDIGYYDENGRLNYVERKRDLIKCMDNQVTPSKLEAFITKQFPAVAEACVVGLPHLEYGEAAAAFVMLKLGHEGDVSEDDIKNAVAENMASHNHLHCGVYFPDSLPRTATGKVQRAALQKDPKYKMRR